MSSLPEDAVAQIARLKELLVAERDPIDRHFMFHTLEAALYRARHALPTALADFDDACRRHDSEMDGLRAAFITKWGCVPWLQLYRQMCIREQKLGDYQQALWWAERGLAVYGTQAARQEAIEDLRERAVSCRIKVARREPEPRAARVRSPLPTTEETLKCGRCGAMFERPRLRGRKPSLCPKCRGEVVPGN